MTLDDIAIVTTTDKSSNYHCYAPFYSILSQFRNKEIRLLEIGVFHGDSIRLWRHWWPQGKIVGIDNFDHDKVATGDLSFFVHANAYCQETIDLLGPRRWDIIVEDGTHLVQDQAFVVANYSPLLSQDGILIIEDSLGGTEGVPQLVASIPEGFWHAVVDLRTCEKNTHGSILFLVWRK